MKGNRIFLAPYQHPLSGLYVAVHEYCHCFTHRNFNEALGKPNWRLELVESLTEHMSDKVIPSATFNSQYQKARLPNGKKWMDAVQELADAVGEVTLMRAYFSGDKDAIRKVFSVALNIFPKTVTYDTWDAIKKADQSYLEEKERMVKKAYKLALNSRNKKAISKAKEGFNIPSYKQHLAECFVGASLLEGGKLPPPRSILSSSYAHELLPVSDFSRIGFWQQKDIKRQADQARKRLGAVFDQAFYNFDKEAAVEAMKAVHEDLQTNWKRILPEMKAHYFAVQD